MSLAFD